VEVANTGDTPVPFPSELRYEAGHLEGYVTAPGGMPKPFRSVVRCLEDAFPGVLEPGASRVASLTLLRGPDGALFGTPGIHRVDVMVRWSGEHGVPLRLHGRADVWIDGTRDEAHGRAAATVLAAPDLSVVVALGGGEHLQEGIEALDAALAAEPLRPHYRVTQAMRLGRPFFTRDASQADAVDALDGEVVATTAEIERAARMLAAGRGERAPSVEPAAHSLRSAATETAAGERLSGLLDGLG
jgi:hypothetical protein